MPDVQAFPKLHPSRVPVSGKRPRSLIRNRGAYTSEIPGRTMPSGIQRLGDQKKAGMSDNRLRRIILR